MKKFLAIFLSVFFVLSCVPVSAAADTGIIAELEAATVGGAPFNFANYPKNTNGTAQLISLSEIGYTTSGAGSGYALYLYVYNPTEKAIVTSGKNRVTIATQYNESGAVTKWEEFELWFVEASENNRFLKFQIADRISVHDGKKIAERVDRAERRYMLSELEIQYIGDTNATAFDVGTSYTYTGYQASSNLTLETASFTTFEIDDLSFTCYRTETSSLGVGHKNQLSSAYFTIPKEMKEEYGKLVQLSVTWNEQKTAPVFVVDSADVVSGLSPYIGVNIGKYSSSVPYGMGVLAYAGTASEPYGYEYAYNINYNLIKCENQINKLAYIFYTDKFSTGKVSVTSQQFQEHVTKYGYADWLFSDEVDEGRIKGEQTTDIGVEDFVLESFGSTHGWWSTFLNYTIKGIDAYDDLKVAPIHEVTESDLSVTKTDAQIAAALYIAEEDVAGLRTAYAKAKLNGDSVWLFRFAATDYYSVKLDNIVGASGVTGYLSEETVFLDFSVISLTLEKDGISTVIPVIHSPQDYFPPVTDPFDSDRDWSWVIKLIAAIVLIVCLWPLALKLLDVFGELHHNVTVDINAAKQKRREKTGKRGKK